MPKQYLLIGASAASFGALHSLRKFDPHARIILITAEAEWPYNKCKLADYLGGSIDQKELSLYPNVYEDVTLVTAQKVIAIDSKNKTVLTDASGQFGYDSLFLGIGSSPLIPKIPGIENQGVFTFHTNKDATSILEYIKKNSVKKVIVIGAGLSGLEAADALIKHQIEVTIVERNNQVLSSLLCQESAQFLQNKILGFGAPLFLNAAVTEFLFKDQKAAGVSINGVNITGDMVIIAVGLQQNIQLCQQSGISIDNCGVVVNEFMQTNIPDIYAGGDIIGVYDQLTAKKVRSCLWPDAMQQGMHAGMAMAGKPKSYPGSSLITSTSFFGLKFARAGIISNDNNRLVKRNSDSHRTFIVQDGILNGFQVLDDSHNLSFLRRMILTRQPVALDQL